MRWVQGPLWDQLFSYLSTMDWMLGSLHWMGMRTWNKIRTKIETLRTQLGAS
ncbi:Hypothetical protein SMAX5B_012211 [Scophthalmus maximus]|uniref:Uncharacterized protein n=1 Tax=Scophthalmus maximus TaxID=52904 RepID=A0A2U9AYM1_SCOMX|nr:Hypothetical protein SMAX5B_012211 [Scophthalmus maximus]